MSDEQATANRRATIFVVVAALVLAGFTAGWYVGYYMGVSDTVSGKKGYVCQ